MRHLVGVLCVCLSLTALPAAQATPSHSSTSVRSRVEMPARFRGTWTMYPEACSTGGETNITVTNSGISFYEDRGKFVSVKNLSQQEVRVRMVRGLPHHPTAPVSARLRVSDDGNSLALISPGDLKVVWLSRCP